MRPPAPETSATRGPTSAPPPATSGGDRTSTSRRACAGPSSGTPAVPPQSPAATRPDAVCGICGVVAAPGDRPSLELVARMCEALVHRGPDDSGTVVQGPAALGMRRLSIIDLAGGHQPVTNDDETVWVVFNGEIYNHPDLREEL